MLEDLRDREMILQREESSFAGTVEYVFRHAILRDVTYETVIPRQRRALHKLVGDWLLEVGGERAGEHTLLVAEHYSRAEEVSLAAAQLAKAGERATLLATYEEAGTLLQRAHEILTGSEHTVQRLGVEMLRANLESIRGRYPKALEILKPASEEARSTGNLPLLASVLGQLGRVSMWLADEVAAVKYIGEALELSRKVGDKEAMIFNLRQMGNALVQTKPSESRKYHEESVQLARQVGDNNGVAHGLNSLAIAFQLEGNSNRAMATFLESLQLNRELGDRLNEAMVLGNLAGLYSAAGDVETAERSARESMAIAKEIGALSLLPTSHAAMAEICLRFGRDTEALQWIRATGETIRSMGIPMSMVTLLYGIHKIRSGDRARGLAWVGFARAHDPNKMEIASLIRSFWPLIRGEASEDEVEAALRAGEGLKLEEILAEAERER